MASAIEHQELLQVKLEKEIEKLTERNIKEDKRIYEAGIKDAIKICDETIQNRISKAHQYVDACVDIKEKLIAKCSV